MIDLHLHTFYSDGASSPELLLEDAQKSGVKAIAITDHNSIKAYEHLKNIDIKKYYKGKILKGVEITCFYNGKIIELLGYGVDLEKMQSFLDEHYSVEKLVQKRQAEFDELEARCREMGVKTNHVLADESQSFSIPFYINNIMLFPENKRFFDDKVWGDSQLFFRNYVCNPQSPFYIDFSKSYLSAKEAANVIRSCGGKAVLAHAWIYRFEDTMQTIEQLYNQGCLDGIECYYFLFSSKQQEDLISFCQDKNLLITGGSDYHGTNRNASIGTGKGTLFVPDSLLNQFPEDFYFVK